MQNQDKPLTVGILIFDDVEVLDFCGPFEVFSTARPVEEHSDAAQIFTVLTIAEQDKIIKHSNSINIALMKGKHSLCG